MSNTSSQLIPHKWAEVIKAWADGKEIQNKSKNSHVWHDCPKDDICVLVTDMYEREWRIKPEAKTGWINIYSSPTEDMIAVHATQESAKQGRLNSYNEVDATCIACIQITYTEGEGLEGV